MTTQQPCTSTSYKTRFETHLNDINAFLQRLLQPRDPEPLWHAMRHGVLNGGKRLRPVLLMETCTACGGQLQDALPTAAAVELIHCFSLIHDDLPCMDDDDFRRGQPTVHKAFDEATALLAGDALLAMAFGVVSDHTPQTVAPEVVLKVISELAQCASVEGLINGQVDDMLAMQCAPNEALLYQIHSGKTAALFQFVMRAGGRLAGQSNEVIMQLDAYGKHLGLAFQIVDDLLDVKASRDVLGKTPGKDVAQGKLTFPGVFGLDETEKVLKQHIEDLHQVLENLPDEITTENLRFLVQFVEEREF